MEVRKITRFNTRKFYDYTDHNYVTFEHIANCVSNGERVEVKDESGNDITNLTFIKALGRRADNINSIDLIGLIKEAYCGT